MQQLNDTTAMFGERELKQALPGMNNTLSNWTLHSQNVGNIAEKLQTAVQAPTCRPMERIGTFL